MKTRSPSGSRGRAGVRISNLPPWLSLLCMVIYIKEEPAMQIRVLKTLDISNPHSIVRNYLQFVPVCLSLSHLHPVSKNAANPWGQIWVTGFGAGQGAFVGHSGSRKLASGLSRCFDCMAREKQQAGPVPAARFPQAGIARPLPPDPTGRLRSWRRIHWPTESPRQHPGARAGPLRGRRTSHPIPFAWQWPAARPAPACRRKASGRRPSQP